MVVGDGGESYETWYAVHRFQEAGFETKVAAPSKRRLHLVMHDFEPGWDTYKESPGYAMESDLTFEEVAAADYEAILREFDAQEKWIFAICHGVQLVAAAGLAKGKTITCYEHIRLEVETSGGRYVARDAVRDGRLVSSPTWREHPAFYREMFTCLNAMSGTRPLSASAAS